MWEPSSAIRVVRRISSRTSRTRLWALSFDLPTSHYGAPMASKPSRRDQIAESRPQLYLNALSVGVALGCETWLSYYNIALALAVGVIVFAASAVALRWLPAVAVVSARGLFRLYLSDADRLIRRRRQIFAGLALLMVTVLITDSRWRADDPHLYASIEFVGLILIAACVLGRAWCHTRTTWHALRGHNDEAYALFTCVGSAGIAAQPEDFSSLCSHLLLQHSSSVLRRRGKPLHHTIPLTRPDQELAMPPSSLWPSR